MGERVRNLGPPSIRSAVRKSLRDGERERGRGGTSHGARELRRVALRVSGLAPTTVH
jgi:hypothetical protein